MSTMSDPSRNNKKSTSINDLVRLLWFIVLLPLWLLLIGPSLVLAGILGQFSIGVMKLNPSRYHQRGRLWALLFGVLVWGFSWGFAFWLWQSGYILETLETYAPDRIRHQLALMQPTTPPSPSPTIVTLTATNTPLIPTATNLPTATATSTQMPTPTASPSPTLSPTSTRLPTRTAFLTPTSAASPTPSLTPTEIPIITIQTATTPVSSSLTVTNSLLSNVESPLDPLQLLTKANGYLINYIQDPSAENEAQLETIWANKALADIQIFASQINVKYQKPLTITYQILDITSSTPLTRTTPTTATMQSRELWHFEDITTKKDSLSDYVYTLRSQQGGVDSWQIIDYTFVILQAVPTPSPVPLTTTQVITSE